MPTEQSQPSHIQLNPYLNFNGQCEAAFKFYEQCFGGQVGLMLTHENSPMAEQLPPDWHQKILHATLIVGDRILMGSDTPPEYYEAPKGIFVQIGANTADEAERLFQVLAENGTVKMPIQQTFWAIRFGMLVDQFGIPWMINCDSGE